VMLENHSYNEIIGNAQNAPYLNSLAQQGAIMTNSFAVQHPSQPNYLELFSGSNQGVNDNSYPHTFSTPNLGGELIAAGYSFAGYSEDQPSVGYTGPSVGNYEAELHPWQDFTDIPSASNLPFAGYFPSDFSQLPTVSYVEPNVQH